MASQWLVAAKEGSRGHLKTLHDVLDLGWLKQQIVEFIKIQTLDLARSTLAVGTTVLVSTWECSCESHDNGTNFKYSK